MEVLTILMNILLYCIFQSTIKLRQKLYGVSDYSLSWAQALGGTSVALKVVCDLIWELYPRAVMPISRIPPRLFTVTVLSSLLILS